MMFLLRSVLVWCLFVFLANPASARIAYQLIVYGDNVPESVVDKVAANGLSLLSKVLSNLPGYQALGPGQYEHCPNNRELQSEVRDKILPELEIESGPKKDEELHHRDLQAGSQCPASCRYKSSSTCRNIGCCATCGRRRRRLRRSLAATPLLTCSQAKLLEGTMDTTLALSCLGRIGCSLKSKILSVELDGSVAPVC